MVGDAKGHFIALSPTQERRGYMPVECDRLGPLAVDDDRGVADLQVELRTR
jgi:hypothetical protein